MKKQTREENFSAASRLIKTNKTMGLCIKCGNPGVWRGGPLPFRVYYLDGDSGNEEPDNLLIMCPNCFASTDQSDYGKQGE